MAAARAGLQHHLGDFVCQQESDRPRANFLELTTIRTRIVRGLTICLGNDEG